MKKTLLLLLALVLLTACSKSIDDEKTADRIEHDELAIHKASYTGDIDLVKELLESPQDVDVRDSFGGTALHAAMFQDNMEIVSLLIENGYDVNAQGSSNGFTPLHDAVWAGNIEAAKLLLESGADLSIKNKDGQTPLDKAKDANDSIYDLFTKDDN
ncbi:ankyrin repeat domain-containing protein [Acidaminobacter sp. JC074]|uniref:ankyrin repeat domain-containing protein n=1 Tax=Acidaminobacter sp. JC074 TaxID=2530199 RepID=UPI001F10A90C|nr:ankyrin repeat domain-containing protein [Acidaminobacter sp. JC074]MCH4889213.1 ankyrin repeat domain-containing protein [Acidaminobacter sp. JC074]